MLLGRVADRRSGCARTPSRPGVAGRRSRRRGRRSRRAPGSSPIAASTAASNVTPSVCDAVASSIRTPERAASPAAAASSSARQRTSRAASGVRPSIQSRTPDGTVVNAFGSTSMRAAVTRKSGSPPDSSSAATISRAAAASASRRSARRVVPAWSARPANVSARRMREASARTAPAGAPSRSRSRVWSMWSSTKPRRRSSHDGASASAVRVGSGRAHRVGERDPVVVGAREHVGDVEPPDQRARAERRRVEARALLVGERDHRDARQPLGDREARRHAERAVEAAAAADAVEMRARRPPRPGRVRDRPQRAGRVALDAQPGGPRLRAEPRLGGRELGRPGEPVRPVRAEPDRLEAREPVAQLGRLDHEPTRQAWSGAPDELAGREDRRDGVVAEAVRDVLGGAVEQQHVGALAALERAELARTTRARRRR